HCSPFSDKRFLPLVFLLIKIIKSTTFTSISLCEDVPEHVQDVPEHCQRLPLYKNRSVVW
ncbi:hypothetical protein, partial [Cronobacter dublinensis]|uniref:hypothetical protein n=1 Tax=Cronobacter dublinensis TaxID=413497 RepID=UPI001F2899EE